MSWVALDRIVSEEALSDEAIRRELEQNARPLADRLPGVCAGLHATGSVGTVAAQRLLDLAWEWTGKDIGAGLALSPPSYRDQELADLGKPLASVLRAAAAIGAASTRDTVSRYIRQQGDAVTVLEMSTLRAAAELPRDSTRGDAAELPVTHVTRRQGRPYTLVLNKTDALFAREQEARARDQADLEWLAAKWDLSA